MSTSPRSRGTLYPHRLDFTSLWFGLVFTAVGLIAVANPGGVGRLDLGLLGAGVVIAVGVGILGSLLTTADQPVDTSPHAEPRSVPLPTPESVREEDRAWFELDTPLSDVEREILEAVQAEEQRDGHAGHGDSLAEDADRSAGEGTADDATG